MHLSFCFQTGKKKNLPYDAQRQNMVLIKCIQRTSLSQPVGFKWGGGSFEANQTPVMVGRSWNHGARQELKVHGTTLRFSTLHKLTNPAKKNCRRARTKTSTAHGKQKQPRQDVKRKKKPLSQIRVKPFNTDLVLKAQD